MLSEEKLAFLCDVLGGLLKSELGLEMVAPQARIVMLRAPKLEIDKATNVVSLKKA